MSAGPVSATPAEQAAGAAPVSPVQRRLGPVEHLRGAWRDRHLIGPLSGRVIVKQYSMTILGRAWLVIRPIGDTFARALIFGGVLGATAPNGVPYLLFLLLGMMVWRLFDRTLFWATRSFERYRRFTRTLDFPLLLAPVAASTAAILDWVLYGLMAVVTIAAFWVIDGELYLELGPQLLMAVAGTLLAFLLALGLGLSLSVFNARARDVRFSLRYGLEIWLYVTPVIYPLEDLSGFFRVLAQINPVTGIVELTKAGLLDAGHVTAGGLGWSIAATVLALGSGLWVFSRKAEWAFPRTLEYDDEDDEDVGR